MSGAEGRIWEVLPAMMWTTDRDLRVTSAAGAAFTRMGVDPPAWIGRTITEFGHAQGLQDVPDERHRRVLAGAVLTHRQDLLGRSFDIRLEPLRDEQGEIQGVVGVALDITERVQAERAREEATTLARTVVASAGQGIVAYDRELRYVLWNPFMARLTGYPESAVLGRHVRDVFPQLEQKGVIRLLEGALLGEEGRSVDISFDYKETGRAGWTSATYSPRRDAEGRIDGVMAIVTDVTDRRRAELVQSAYGRIAAAANAATDLDQAFRDMHAVIGELMPARNFYIALLDAEAGMIRYPYFVDEFDEPPPPQPLRKGLTEYVLRHGPLLATPEVFEQLAGSGEVQRLGSPSVDWMGVPLTTPRGTIGVLAVQSYTPGHRYTEQEKDILAFMAHEVALAVEKRLAEERLRASEERFRALIEHGADGMSLLDREGQVVYEGPSCARIFGPALPYLGGDGLAHVHPDDLPALRTVFADLLARPGVSRQVAYRRRHADGRWLWMEGTATSMLHVPAVEAIVLNFRDVTARRRVEEETRRLAEMKSNFLTVASHEMRTPLTVLTGNMGLLRMGPLTPVQEDAVSRCERTLAAMSHALGDMLMVVQLEKGGMVLRRAATDVAALAGSVVEELRPFADRRRQELRLTIAGDLPRVELDRDRVRLALVDLVQNAIKFTPDGGAVEVVLGAEPPWLHVQVKDSGIGIASDELQGVFEHFNTGADPRYHRSGTFEFQTRGAGLGLAIVKGYAEAHGGRVWAESAGAERGSTFHMLLPLEP